MKIECAKRWLKWAGLATWLVWPSLALAQERAPQAASESATRSTTVDPEAVAALDRMGEALRKLDRFSLVSEASSEVVLEDGQKVTLQGHTTYRVQRPDHLYIELKSDRRLRELFYDGKTMTVYAPRLKYYASAEHVDKTLGELAISLEEDYGIELPLADLFFWGTEHASRDALKGAMYVGPGLIDEEETEQYAFRQEDTDWQVWISRKNHLPQKLVITSLEDPAMPQYQARLRWNTQQHPDLKSFTFVPPADASRIELVPIGVAVVDSPAEGR